MRQAVIANENDAMNDGCSKCDIMSIEEATVANIWAIAAWCLPCRHFEGG
jgi:hypothetical protein